MYRISENHDYNSREVYFDNKPSTEVLTALKGLKMRWNFKKSCWYGYASESALIDAITSAGEPVATDGYMGGGATYGAKSRQYLSDAELSKAIREDLKAAKLPIKSSVKKHSYSGGRTIYVTVKMSDQFFLSESEYVNARLLDDYWSFYWFTAPNGESIHREKLFSSQYNEDERRAIIEHHFKSVYKSYIDEHTASNFRDDDLLTDAGNDILKRVGGIIEAYRYDNSNGMVDYFDTNFYYDIIIKREAQ